MEKAQDKLRCYHFNNFYFGGVHAGIQSHHASMEIFIKNRDPETFKTKMLYDWAENHKTVIVLNGGMQFNLEELSLFMEKEENPFPWAPFKEAQIATNETLTNVGIVLPDYIFKMSRLIANNHPKVLMSRGIGDGKKYEDSSTTIEIVDGGILVSYVKQKPSFSLIQLLKDFPIDDSFELKNHFYSDWEVELMARMSMCSLMS